MKYGLFALILVVMLSLGFTSISLSNEIPDVDQDVKFKESDLGAIGASIDKNTKTTGFRSENTDSYYIHHLYISVFTKLLLDDRLSGHLTDKDRETLLNTPMPSHTMFSEVELEAFQEFCSTQINKPDLDQVDKLASAYKDIVERSGERVSKYYKNSVIKNLSPKAKSIVNRETDPNTTSINVQNTELDIEGLGRDEPVFVKTFLAESCNKLNSVDVSDLPELYLEDKIEQ